MAVSNKQCHVSDAQFRRDVANTIHSTDGIWGPSTKDLKKVNGETLKGPLKKAYEAMKDFGEGDADVFTTTVDCRGVYLFTAHNSEVGAGMNDLRDEQGHSLKMGDRPHEKIPLPHSEEPAHPASRKQWITDLADAMRYPVQASETPIVTGREIPEGVQTVVDRMKAEKDTDGVKTFESVEVHHVRVDGRDSYLIYGSTEDGESQEMYEADGTKLDLSPWL